MSACACSASLAMFSIRSAIGTAIYGIAVALIRCLWLMGPATTRFGKRPMWQRQVAALFVMLALAGCARGNTGQAGDQYSPYSQGEGSRPEHGGGDGGGGGGM